jgi:signal peptidase I
MLSSTTSKAREICQTFGEPNAIPLLSSVIGVLSVPTQFVAVLALATVLFKASFLEAFYVPSSSMAPTLQANDYILVPKFTYGLRVPFLSRSVATWSEPQRGDVVVFRRTDDPRTSVDESERLLVKRVVAVGGDTVEVRGASLFVNGTLQDEPYARWGESGTRKDFTLRRVPEGAVFVLGDNRDQSQDSRFWSAPFVRMDEVLGKALCVYWSKADTNRVGITL